MLKLFVGKENIITFAKKIHKDMSRNGSGNAWKHRQWREHGLSGRPRNLKPRKLKCEPQYTFEQLYISPMRQKRRYTEDGQVFYDPIERKTNITGIRIFDEYVQYLSNGYSDLQAFADARGLRREDIDSMVFVLTGMRGVDFRLAYQMRMADELLRYTNMTVSEVAKRSGIGSANNLYLAYKRDFNLAPGYRRKAMRQPGDVGRYTL